MSSPGSIKEAVGHRVREARKLAGLSQGQLAKILGLHRPSVSEIEAGNRNVTADELKKIAETCEVTVSWLMGDTADERENQLKLAARELSKLKPDDFKRLMTLLASLRREEER